MNDLLKAAQAVLDVWDKLDNGKWETEGDFHNLDCQYREALDTLRQAVEQAKGASVDALIAELDDLSPSHVNDEYGCKHSDTLIMYHACDIKAILDKYRARSGQC